MERSKRNGRKKNNKQVASAAAAIIDEYHSLETPCCTQVIQVTTDVFPEAKSANEGVLGLTSAVASDSYPTEASSSSSSLFGSLVRTHLLQERSKAIDAAASPGKRKTRKKRKKKGKGKGGPLVATTTTPTTTTPTTTTTTKTTADEHGANGATASEPIRNGSAPQHQEGTTESTKILQRESKSTSPTPTPAPTPTLSPQDQATVITTTTTTSNPPPPPPPLAAVTTTDAIVLQWLDRLQPPAPVSSSVSSEPSSSLKQQQPKPLHPDRTLVAFCQSLLTTSTNNNNNSNNNNSNNQQGLQQPRLSIAAISAALRATKCMACRGAAESYWQSTGMPMVELGLVGGGHHAKECIVLETSMVSMEDKNSDGILSIPVAGQDEWGSSTDSAFDYQAMEEGTMNVTTASSPNTEEVADQFHQSPHNIVVLEPVADKEGTIESMQVTTELDATVIERLVRQIILPCGLVELEHIHAVALSNDEYENVVTHVKQQQSRIWVQLQGLSEKKAKVHKLFHATELEHSTSTYNVRAAKKLNNCDKECDELLTALVNMLMQMTTLTDGLPTAPWAHTRTDKMWQHYERGVQRILRMSLQHEAKLLQLANRPGVVPQLFTNVSHRASFRDLVAEKCDVLEDIYNEFFSALCTDVDSTKSQPTFFRRLLTWQPFTTTAAAASKAKGDNKNDGANSNIALERTKLDAVIGRLVESFTNFIHSVKSFHVTEIHNAQEIKSNQLFELLRESTSMIVEEYQSLLTQVSDENGTTASIDQSHWKELRKEGTDLISQYSTYQSRSSSASSTTNHADGVVVMNGQQQDDESFIADFTTDGHNSAALATMRLDLVRLVVNMISQWRCLRWMRSQTLEAPIMPLRLIRWMDQPDLVVAARNDVSNDDKTVCHGGGGKRRLGSVLSSLLYQWLVDRCNEWHAEITQAELLEAMEDLTGSSEMNGSASKTSKKKKKKKATTAPKPAEMPSNPIVEPPSLSKPSKPESTITVNTKPVKEEFAAAPVNNVRASEDNEHQETKEERHLETKPESASKMGRNARIREGHQPKDSKKAVDSNKKATESIKKVTESNKKVADSNKREQLGGKKKNHQKREPAVAKSALKEFGDSKKGQQNNSTKDPADSKKGKQQNNVAKEPTGAKKGKPQKNVVQEPSDFKKGQQNNVAKGPAESKKGQQNNIAKEPTDYKKGQQNKQSGKKNWQPKDAAGNNDTGRSEGQTSKEKSHAQKDAEKTDAFDSSQHQQQQPKEGGSKRKKRRNRRSGDKENGTHSKKPKTAGNEEEQKAIEPAAEYASIAIGVEDSSGNVEPVEDFLISRLFHLLKDDAKTDAGGKPIIFL